MLLQMFWLLAMLAQLPQAGIQVCTNITADDIVVMDHRMGLGSQVLCTALHKLQPVAQSLPSDVPYPSGIKAEQAGMASETGIHGSQHLVSTSCQPLSSCALRSRCLLSQQIGVWRSGMKA